MFHTGPDSPEGGFHEGVQVRLFVCPALHHFGTGGLLGLVLLMFGLIKVSTLLARRMEHRADDAAVQGNADAASNARALEKLYIANQIPAVMRGNSMVHPHLFDRMLAAGVTPDFPRPAPPGLMAWPGWAVFLIPLGLLVAMAIRR